MEPGLDQLKLIKVFSSGTSTKDDFGVKKSQTVQRRSQERTGSKSRKNAGTPAGSITKTFGGNDPIKRTKLIQATKIATKLKNTLKSNPLSKTLKISNRDS